MCANLFRSFLSCLNIGETRLSTSPSQTEISSISFIWTIKKFSSHVKRNGCSVQSSPVSSSSAHKAKWYLVAYPNGCDKKSENYLSLFMHSEMKDDAKPPISLELVILNINHEKSRYGQKRKFVKTDQKGLFCGSSRFVKTSDVLDEGAGLLLNDTLTIYCEIKFLTKLKTTTTVKIPECRLGNDLSELLEKELFSDVKLVANGTEFKVHKNILAARSTVFAAVLSHKSQDIIEIADVGENELYYMLYFIYSGKAPEDVSVQLISDLLIAAEKYNLDRLKVMCEKILCPQLTNQNALDLLVLANSHQAPQLKTGAMDFINSHLSVVKTAENWKSLVEKYPSLLNQVFDYHLQHEWKNKNE